MCSAVAVGVAGIGLNVIGSIMKNVSNIKAKNANSDYLNSMADTSEQQAQEVLNAAEIQSKYIVTSAAKQNQQSRENFKRTIGTQKVVFASNGIGGGSVTAQDVALDSLARSQEDEDLIRYNADVQSGEIFRNSSFQATQLRTQAAHYRTAAKNELASIPMDNAASLINFGANASGSILQLSKYL